MKSFNIWLLAIVVTFGAISGVYHHYLSQHPRLVAVTIDSSLSMKDVWEKVPETIQGLGEKRYSNFSLFTERKRLYGWSPELVMQNIVPYGPRKLDKLQQKIWLELQDAEQLVLVTTKKEESDDLNGWQIIALEE